MKKADSVSYANSISIGNYTLGIMQMRLYKRLHVLHPITLVEAAKGKNWLFRSINPTYSMADEDQVPCAQRRKL